MQWTMVDGVRRSHIIDPRTGYGATDSVQVTVQGPDGATVDALATALSLAGPSSRPALSERFPLYWFAFPAEP
jgi:thiamine biosynthesis lipoprotein